MYSPKSSMWLAAFAALALAFLPAISEAGRPDKPGGGGGGGGGGEPAASYEFIDLLGFENGNLGYQSSARFVMNRGENGTIAVLGDSFQRYIEGYSMGSAFNREARSTAPSSPATSTDSPSKLMISEASLMRRARTT